MAVGELVEPAGRPASRPARPSPPATTAVGGDTRPTWGFPHVAALDGLRGAAVVAVLIFHAGHLTGGYLGVDLFFVLSGFLITSLLLSERTATGHTELKAFWIRRVRRLLPALLALMAGIALYAVVISHPVDLGTVRADGFAALFYVANWRTIIHGTNYWDLALAPSPLDHVWSLAIEEQFYLVWPFVFVLLTRRRKDAAKVVFLAASAGAAVSAALFVGFHAAGMSDTRVYEGTDTRAAALLLGAALAAYRFWQGHPTTTNEATPAGRAAAATWTTSEWLTELSGVAAVVVLGAMWFGLDGQSKWLYRGGLPFASVLAMWVVAVASRPGSPLVGWVFSFRPLRALGKISYGLYLWHWPIFKALDARNGDLPFLGDRYLHDPLLLVIKLVLSLGAALLSYEFIERPIRRGAIHKPFGTFAAFGGIYVAAVLIFVSTLGAVAAPGPANIDGQAKVKVAGGPVVVFAGDSVSLSLVGRVAADPVRFGINPINRALIGCSIAYAGVPHRNFNGSPGTTPPSCADAAVKDLQAAHPAAVFFLTGARPNDFAVIDGASVRACDPAFDERYQSLLEDLVHKLGATGAPVVLGTVPHSGANATNVEGAETRIDCMAKDVRAVAAAVPGTEVVDVNAFLCPDGKTCTETLDGGPVRSEGLHFDAGPGGDAVADWYVQHILSAAGLKPAPGTRVREH